MGTHTHTGPIPNIFATTDSHHPFLGGINGHLDPESGFHIIGRPEDCSITTWTPNHLEDLLESKE